MNFWFTIREGFKGFRRARLATSITITSVAFSHLLIGIFLTFILNVDYLINDVRSKVELEVFLDPTIGEKAGREIQAKITKIKGTAEVNYLSKAQAAEKFKKEFGSMIYM